MRIALMLLLVACAADAEPPLDGKFEGTKTYSFAYDIAPSQEISRGCAQISLNNKGFVNVNALELTGDGLDHSNWFIVPDFVFPGEDGAYNCDARGFHPQIAATKGVV